MSQDQIRALEKELYEKQQELTRLRRENEPTEVPNYTFATLEGETTLLQLFGGHDTLFLVHNMGPGCRYCTLWADGINPFLQHLEEQFAVAMVSKDTPDAQRRMANARGWRFRMASHRGTDYIKEQDVADSDMKESGTGYPGMVCYTRKGDKIFRKNTTTFGPGDEFCTMWNILALAGENAETWTPQFNYWKRPEKMDDGGQNLN